MSLPRRLADSVSVRSRKQKLQAFLETFAPTSATTVLDVGFNDHEYVPGENFLEKHYPWPWRLTALGIDEPVECPQRYPDVTFVHYDGSVFPFEDGQFDIAYSNAVVEHVGAHDRQRLFLSELLRVSRAVWMTTPSRGFPVDTHTLIPLAHWLPQQRRDAIYRRLGKSWATGDTLSLLYRRDLERLLRDCGVSRYRIVASRFAGWPMAYAVVVDRR